MKSLKAGWANCTPIHRVVQIAFLAVPMSGFVNAVMRPVTGGSAHESAGLLNAIFLAAMVPLYAWTHFLNLRRRARRAAAKAAVQA